MTQAVPPSMLHVLHDQAARLGDRPALWTKKAGYYLPVSWRDLAAQVRHFALGLRRLGFGKGDVLLLASANREEWVVAHLAGMALGGTPVGWPAGADRQGIGAALRRFGAKAALVDRIEGPVPAAWTKLATIISLELRPANDAGGATFPEVLQSGMGRDEGPYWESVNGLQPDQPAMVACTSGATKAPRPVVLSHRNLAWTSRRLAQSAALQDGDVVLCHQPLAFAREQLVALHLALAGGLQTYFAQGDRPLWDELCEVRPHVLHTSPRAYQELLRHLESIIHGGSAARRAAAAWAKDVALRRHLHSLAHEHAAAPLLLQYEVSTRGVLQRLKEDVGLQRAKLLLSSGEPMDRASVEAFFSLDLRVNEAYGSTETTGLVSLGTTEAMKLGACGRPLLGVEVKVLNGEVLVRGPNVCLGYLEDGKTAPALSKDGWLHTGDAGQLDPDGFLRVAGRVDELLSTTGAKKVAPAAIEWLLTRLQPLEDAVVMRSASGALAAVVTLEPHRATALARERGWPTDPERLSEHPAFLAELQRRIDAEVNVRLSRWEAIRAVVVLPRSLRVESGDLTATLQLRRRELHKRHGPAVNALFDARSTDLDADYPRRSIDT